MRFFSATFLTGCFTSRKRVAACLAGLAFASSGAVSAEEPPHPEKPLLWKVEGNGLEKPSYLFGTIHIGSPPVATLHPAAEKAFDGADAVYTEIALDAKTQLGMTALFVRKDGKKLSDSIGAELKAGLEAELKEINPALNITPFEFFQTWVPAVTVPLLPYQMKGEKALDARLWEAAEKAGKQTAALEKPEEQLAIFNDLTEKEQTIFLSETLRQLREDRAEGRNTTEELISAYISGEPDRVQAELEKHLKELAESEHRELGERVMKRLIDNRDESMAGVIHETLTAHPGKSHFFAAGALHYTGDTSIRSHLAARGYAITRITE